MRDVLHGLLARIGPGKLYLSTKPYQINRSREAGEHDLFRLALSSNVEGAWLFSQERNTWYNLALQHLELEDDYGLLTAGFVLGSTSNDNLPTLNERISHYHIHPRKLGDASWKRFLQRSQLDLLPDFVGNYKAAGMALPSPTDLQTYIALVGLNPHTTLDFKVVSEYGVSTLQMRDPIIARTTPQFFVDYGKCFTLAAREAKDESQAVSLAIERVNEGFGYVFTVQIQPHKF